MNFTDVLPGQSSYSGVGPAPYSFTGGPGGAPSSGLKGVTSAYVAMLVVPFVSTAVVNRMVYSVPLMSSSNLVVPLGMAAGNFIPVPFAFAATGMAAGVYFGGLSTTHAAVLVGGGMVLGIGMDMAIAALLVGSNMSQ